MKEILARNPSVCLKMHNVHFDLKRSKRGVLSIFQVTQCIFVCLTISLVQMVWLRAASRARVTFDNKRLLMRDLAPYFLHFVRRPKMSLAAAIYHQL